jgi:hypothetical protein
MKVILRVPDEGYSESTWWRLFQKRVVCTKFDFYVLEHNIEKYSQNNLHQVLSE